MRIASLVTPSLAACLSLFPLLPLSIMPSTYSIEHAKSSRSSCKKCREKIEKGELRIGSDSSSGNDDYTMTSWFHVKCFVIPKALKKEGVTAASFVCDSLVDNTEDNSLEERKDEIIADIEEVPLSAAKKKKGGDDAAAGTVAKLKAQLASIRAAAEGEPDSKKAKLSEEDAARVDVYAMYEKHTNDQLKDVLTWNRQLKTGNKDLLMARIIDGQLKGRLDRCPMCLKGKLQLEDETANNAICKGYYDEDIGAREPCSFKCPIDQAPRKHPWFTEKPSEEEEAEMDEAAAAVKSGGASAGIAGNATVAAELVAKAEALDWSLNSKEGIKKATEAIMQLCDEAKVDLPTKKKMEVGKIVATNKSLSAAEVMKLVIDQFGFAEQNEEAAKQKAASVSLACHVAANAPLMAVMLELGTLYTAERNFNASTAYKKVAQAIRDLDFEITEENVMGLAKGKTKVEGIGKSSAEKLQEFLTTGKIEKLEEKRATMA